MTYLVEMDPATGFIDGASLGEKGRELCDSYGAHQPFPHAVIDDFLPVALLDMCLAEIGNRETAAGETYDREQERLKREYRPDLMSAAARGLFYSFNSAPFIRLVENITGIKGLIPDPYFLGGGFHEIASTGHLSVHADFNHHRLMNLERRINVLIYLNRDWDADCGGQLELWDRGMQACVQSIVPLFNRCVIFNTTSDSYHGNPRPVSHPQGVSRKSIALYYYTATWDGGKRGHTTQYQVRPGSADQRDWTVKGRELLDDLLPPIIRRQFRRKQPRHTQPGHSRHLDS